MSDGYGGRDSASRSRAGDHGSGARTGDGGPRIRARLALAVGYLAFAAGVVAAWSEPGRWYELDVYTATPVAFWLGIAMAAVLALFVAYRPDVSRGVRTGALALLSLAVLAVAALPILRNYYFWGPGDSLSHLGYTKLLAWGDRSPFQMLYPGIHTITLFVSRVLGVELTRAMQYMMVVFTAVFVAFVPLCVRELTDSRWAVPTGTAVAALLIPINNVSVFHKPYPTAQAIFFVPLLLYLALRYGRLPDDGFPRRPTALGALLGAGSVAIVLLHPQQAGSVLLVLGGIVFVQVLYRRWAPTHRIADLRPLYFQFGLLALTFLLWAPRFPRFYGATSGLINGLLGAEAPGDEVASRSDSLAELGTSVLELFVKLFGVSFLLSVLAGLVVVLVWLDRLEDGSRRSVGLRYLSIGLALLVGTFVVFFAGSVSVLPFRYLGAAMVLVTVFAAVAITDGLPLSVDWPSWRTMRLVAVGAFTLLLAAQMAHVHSSPYIYQPSDQVTKMSMEGYENSFEHRDPDVWFTGVRGGPRRYVDATYGATFTDTTPGGKVFEGKEERIPFAVFGKNVSEYYGRDRYVPVTDRNFQREVGLYDGLRYPISGYRDLRSTPWVHRIRTNGDYRLYYLDEPDEPP